jgi:hypothetical protein
MFCANLSLQIILRPLAVRQARVQISAWHPGYSIEEDYSLQANYLCGDRGEPRRMATNEFD